MSLNQKQIKDLVFADVTAAEAAGRPGEICYVQSLNTFYEYIAAGSTYTVDHGTVLSTGNGGDTRWIATAGQYNLSANVERLYALSTDDATLSGTPVIIRLQAPDGTYYYTKAYPTASATANATIDDIGTDVRGITDATLSGAPKVFEIISGATKYYTKGSPTISAESASSRGITIRAVMFSDTTLSGTPRVATVEIGGADYSFKVYPDK